jgi:hypothetical protein
MRLKGSTRLMRTGGLTLNAGRDPRQREFAIDEVEFGELSAAAVLRRQRRPARPSSPTERRV